MYYRASVVSEDSVPFGHMSPKGTPFFLLGMKPLFSSEARKKGSVRHYGRGGAFTFLFHDAYYFTAMILIANSNNSDCRFRRNSKCGNMNIANGIVVNDSIQSQWYCSQCKYFERKE